MNEIVCGERIFVPSKVICVGRNYTDHIAEIGGAGRSSEPAIFIKPNSAIAFGVKQITVPREHGVLHHEVELCFVVGQGAKGLIAGYAVGVDLTLREMQAEAKKEGLPWTLAKGFDSSAPLGEFVPINQVEDPLALDISLKVNGKTRQKSNTKEMIFTAELILAYTSRFMNLGDGDVFMCGTPSGVGELNHGDHVLAEIKGLPALEFTVKRK